METFENKVCFNLTPCCFTTPLLNFGLRREEKGGTQMGIARVWHFSLNLMWLGVQVSVSVSSLLLVGAHLPLPALNESARGVKES